SALGAQRARAAHLRGAPARRRPDHARGFGGRVRRVARARAPDRGARLREGAAGGEEPPRGDGGAPERPRATGALIQPKQHDRVVKIVVPAHSASKTRVNALMLGTHNHQLWNMGPRFRGDDVSGATASTP